MRALIAETEHELRTNGPQRFEKIGELIDAGATSPEAERELAAYARSVPDDILVHYLPFAIDLGLATHETYGTFLAQLMKGADGAVRDRAFEIATQSGSVASPEERHAMIEAMDTRLAIEQDENRLIRFLNLLKRCDQRFIGLETRLLDIRLNHPTPRGRRGRERALCHSRWRGSERIIHQGLARLRPRRQRPRTQVVRTNAV